MNFWKMHGIGNDYIVIDNRNEELDNDEAPILAKKLCKRRFSIGADGLLLLSNSTLADAKMRIFNADGSEAEMCGNGIRCFAKYCYERVLTKKEALTVETIAGIKRVWLNMEDQTVKTVKVDMGKPILNRSEIPMLGQGTCIDQDFQLNGEKFKITCLSMGNPHCVVFVADVADFPVQRVGSKIENHSLFPNRTNVVFSEVLNSKEIRVRVWERGCGETLACGTGACAAVAAGNLLKKIEKKVKVNLLGGDLDVEYAGSLFMTGPAEKVFEGRLF
ncbi:diaminopimelate epimerase [Candidatus Bathyarchaeota archaeon]|nr:diaminopimelate epimerase [Candidatus Bathyarchaeota archaeon]